MWTAYLMHRKVWYKFTLNVQCMINVYVKLISNNKKKTDKISLGKASEKI